MHGAGKMFRSLRSALNKRFVDDHLGGDVRQFTSLPHLHLLAHRLKVPLHSIHTHRDTVDERERLRVFGEHWSECTFNGQEVDCLNDRPLDGLKKFSSIIAKNLNDLPTTSPHGSYPTLCRKSANISSILMRLWHSNRTS